MARSPYRDAMNFDDQKRTNTAMRCAFGASAIAFAVGVLACGQLLGVESDKPPIGGQPDSGADASPGPDASPDAAADAPRGVDASPDGGVSKGDAAQATFSCLFDDDASVFDGVCQLQ